MHVSNLKMQGSAKDRTLLQCIQPAASMVCYKKHDTQLWLVQVVPVFAGGLDFSAPVKKFFYDPIYKSTNFVDCVISLTG